LRPQAFLPIRRSVRSACVAFAMRPSCEPPGGLSDVRRSVLLHVLDYQQSIGKWFGKRFTTRAGTSLITFERTIRVENLSGS
jgi:hypothetical protein